MPKSKKNVIPEDAITEIPLPGTDGAATLAAKNRPSMLPPRDKKPIENHYDFILLFDVKNGNPNGDPDAGGAPRLNADGYGIVTDGCLKHKLRDVVELLKPDDPYYRQYIRRGMTLNARDNCALTDLFGVGVTDAGNDDDNGKGVPKKLANAVKADADRETKIIDYVCDNFFDVRTFGAVMTTYSKLRLNCSQLRGPVQFGISESIDPIYPQEITITRDAITKEADLDDKNNGMGRKTIVPYGLYRCEGHISAPCAAKTNFTEEDLDILWQAILHIFDEDRSSMRGEMTLRKLIVFKHDSRIGNAPAYKLFERVSVTKNDGVDEPRNYADYRVIVNADDMPKGVELIDMTE